MDNHEILCKIRERMPAEMDAVLVAIGCLALVTAAQRVAAKGKKRK